MKYIDTDVFVYWATDHPTRGERATQIIRHIELNEKAITSALTLWLFDNVMRDHEGYSLRLFVDQVTQLRNLKVIPLEADQLVDAQERARENRLSPHVALAWVVADSKGADAVYSTNDEFDRTKLRREF